MNSIPHLIRRDKKNVVILDFVEITMRMIDLKEQKKLISDREILLDNY